MIYDDKKFIGKVIKNARKNAGLNQAELAEMIDMCDKNIGNIENGKQFPQVNNFLRMIEVLNLSLNDFGVNFKVDFSENNLRAKLVEQVLSMPENNLRIYKKFFDVIEETIQKDSVK